MARCFISYARDDDEDFAQRLHEKLTARGIEVWWDYASMASRGLTLLQEIRDAIEATDRVLVIMGPAVFRSAYVEAEWRYALRTCKVVTPILRLGDQVPEPLKKYHCVDFRVPRAEEEALNELLRILDDPLPRLGALYGVDGLPAHYQERPRVLEDLKQRLLGDVRTPTVIASAQRTTSLQGLGGIGKSVLAAALARDCEVRRAFPDGIFWLRLGPTPDLDASLRFVLSELGGFSLRDVANLRVSAAALQRKVADRALLLVLDDVWQKAAAETYFNALGARSRMLITTRNIDIAAGLGAEEYPVQVLDQQQALGLLASWARLTVDSQPAEADLIVRECESLPLALAMIGAGVRRGGGRWQSALAKLQAADLDRIRGQFPNYPYPSVLRAIEVSVHALEPHIRQHYLSLAAFPEEGVPEAVLALAWTSPESGQEDPQDVIDALLDSSLVRSDEAGRIRLHSLQHDFVRRQMPDTRPTHQHLLSRYEALYPEGWATAEDDGYLFDHLAWHLVGADRKAELVSMLSSREWLQLRLESSGVAALIGDFKYLPGEPGAELIQGALRLSTPTLARDPGLLWSQLYGRLSPAEIPALETLLCDRPASPRLEPITSSLTMPGGTLIQVMATGKSTITALAVSESSGTLAIGMATEVQVRILETEHLNRTLRPADGVQVVAISDDGLRVAAGLDTGRIQVWNVETGDLIAFLKGHQLSRESDWSDRLVGLTFTHGGRRVLSAAWDGLKAWNLESGELHWERAELQIASFRALDSERAALGVFQHQQQNGKRPPRSEVVIVDVGSGQALLRTVARFHLRHDVFQAVAVDAAVKRVATLVNKGRAASLQVWDLESQWNRVFRRPCERGVIELSPDGGLLFSALTAEKGRVGEIEIWDLESGSVQRSLRGHTDHVRGLVTLANGKLVSAAADGEVRVWNLRAERRDIKNVSAVVLAMLPCGAVFTRLASGATEHWDPETGARVSGGSAAGLVAPEEIRKLAQGSPSFQTTTRLTQEPADQVSLWYLGDPDSPSSKQSANQLHIVTSNGDRQVRVVDDWCHLQHRHLQSLLPCDDQSQGSSLSKLAELLDRDQSPGVGDSAARVDDLFESALRSFPGPGACALALSPDDHWLAVGRSQGDVWIWDLESGDLNRVLNGPDDAITDLAVTSDGRVLVAASRDHSITAWDFESGRRLASYYGDVAFTACAVGGPEQLIVAADSRGGLHFLRLVVGEAAALHEPRTPPPRLLEEVRRAHEERRQQEEQQQQQQERDRQLRLYAQDAALSKEADTNLNDELIKVVSYRLDLITAEGWETLEGPREVVIEDNMIGDAFCSSVVADYVLGEPDKLESSDLPFLRVSYQVERRSERPADHSDSQLQALEWIEQQLAGQAVSPDSQAVGRGPEGEETLEAVLARLKHTLAEDT